MKRAILVSTILAFSATAALADGDWKRGRVYYRGVCTACHLKSRPEGIPPNEYTMAEWTAYLAADKHNKGADSVKQYISQTYRTGIKTDNKVADKFMSYSDGDLVEDVKAFVVNGAKDGEAPATCN